MNYYSFSKLESKIIDQLYFPLCAKIYEEIETENGKDNDFVELMPEGMIATYKKMEIDLKPFLKEIEKFYFETNSLASLFQTVYPVEGFEDIHAYLTFIKGLTEEQMLLAIISVLLKGDDDKPFEDANFEAASPYLSDELLRLKMLESLDIEGDEKWKLSSILRDPKVAVDNWCKLMTTLESIYLNYYATFENQIEAVGQSLMDRLNSTSGEILGEITGGRVTNQLLPSGFVIIGFVKMFNIEIRVSNRRPIIYWGMEVETVFNNLKNAADNALINRVQTFKNLGDKTRYEVLRCIASDMQSTKEIAAKLGVSSATISYHLSNLTTSKLLKLVREDGKYISHVNAEWIEACFESLKKDLKI